MARPNRTNRERARFGVSPLIRDWLMESGLHAPRGFEPRDARDVDVMKAHLQQTIDVSRIAHVIRADDVATWFYDHPKSEWDYRDDFPAMAPPFPEMFIDYALPTRYRVKDHVFQLPEVQRLNARAGVVIQVDDHDPSTPYRTFKGRSDAWCNWSDVEDESISGVRWIYRARLVHGMLGSVCTPGFQAELCIDTSGRVCSNLTSTFPARVECISDLANEGARAMIELLSPAFLAICFMNCKNVEVKQHFPDAAHNRARRKEGKPLMSRYSSIEVHALRAHLNREAGGDVSVHRAMHLCRGHFATYNDSFMGRKLSEPVTVWRPAHVRGSAEHGIVKSSHNVHPIEEQ